MGKPQSLIDAIQSEAESEIRLEADKQLRRAAMQIADLKRDKAGLLLANDKLENEKSILLGLHDRGNAKAWSRTPKITKGEAVAVLLLSDLHLEEVVRPETVNGLNEFNPKIAEKRLQSVIERFLLIGEHQFRSLSKVDELLVWLGGDLISGYIHDELVEQNAMSPLRACIFAEGLLEKCLRTILERGNYQRIRIVCSDGNHDRTTHKVRAATRADNAYSMLVYEHLRGRLAECKTIDWSIAKGQFVYVDVLGHKVRFTHGDTVKYGGGVGGISVPLNKAVKRWDELIKADLTCLGHFHNWNWSEPGKWIINGCLPGTTPYGLNFGGNEPCQTALLITKKHGVVDAKRLFTE